jgi:dimethylargininase
LRKKQHAAYAQALLDCGLEVTILPADENHPDCIFVEDQAIMSLMVTSSCHSLGTHQELQNNPQLRISFLRQLNGFQVCGMFGDARMDGGDILRLGNIFFVARSQRTNDAGIETLRNLLTHLGHELRIIDIPTEKALHLTSISSTPTDEVILTAEGFLTADDFGELPEGSQAHLRS